MQWQEKNRDNQRFIHVLTKSGYRSEKGCGDIFPDTVKSENMETPFF
jgi:hypothetical protein